jgi:hypothetical protein
MASDPVVVTSQPRGTLDLRSNAPRLSIMFATIQGWPLARLPIDAVREQVATVGGEVIVMDGSGLPTPDAVAIGPDVTWVSRPGLSVFQLRAEGYDHCQGEVVAVTEDHVAPAADWCEQILAAHATHPEAIAIGGAVANGTTDHLMDWAAFLVTQAASMSPLPDGPAERIAGPATVTYKREALTRRPSHGTLGAIELFDTAGLRRDDEILLNDDAIRVRHHQCMDLATHCSIEFHNGRTIAGFRRRSMTRGDWLRIAGFPILALYRAARTARIAWDKEVSRATVMATVPLLILLHYAQASGEMIGYAVGPGSSPRKLR